VRYLQVVPAAEAEKHSTRLRGCWLILPIGSDQLHRNVFKEHVSSPLKDSSCDHCF